MYIPYPRRNSLWLFRFGTTPRQSQLINEILDPLVIFFSTSYPIKLLLEYSSKTIILVLKICCNKSSYSWCLKKTELYSLTVMGARSLKSKYLWCHAPTEGSGGDSFLYFCFWWLPVFPDLCQHNSSLYFLLQIAFSCV